MSEASPDIFVDKAPMKRFFTRAAIPTAHGFAAAAGDIDTRRLTYPAVFKPATASGARGVRLVTGSDQADAYLKQYGRQFPTLIVETVLAGSQHDVNGFLVDGAFYPAGIGDRFFSDYPLCYPIYGYCPSRLPPDRVSACYDLLRQVGTAAGLVTGPLKADVFVDDAGRVAINEVGLRFHGDITSTMVMPGSGRWFPLPAYAARAAGRDMNQVQAYLEHTWLTEKQTVRWDILHHRPGIFQSLENEAQARRLPGMIGFYLRKSVGDRLDVIEDNAAMLGYFLTRGRSADDCAAIADAVHQTVSVRVAAP